MGVKAGVRGALKKAKAKFGEDETLVQVHDDDKVKWGFIKKAIDHVKKNIPKYIAKGKAAINGALDKAKGWLKGALKKAKATFGEDEMDVEISDEDELEWGFIKTTIDKVKKALPKYVAKGKSAILGALDKVKAGVRGALKKAKAKFGEEEMDVEVFDTDKVKWGFITLWRDMKGHEGPCMAIQGHTWPSRAIQGHAWPSRATHGHTWP